MKCMWHLPYDQSHKSCTYTEVFIFLDFVFILVILAGYVKGKFCVNEDNQINIIIPPANERLGFPSYHIFIYECFSIQFIS